MITAGAAAGDADLRALCVTADAERLAGVRGVVEALAARGALRDGLSVAEAADIAWAFVSPEMWLLLTRRRGWDLTGYQAWLERSLRDSLSDSPRRHAVRRQRATRPSAPPVPPAIAGARNGSAKYCVSCTTCSSANCMMLTEWVGTPS